MTTHLVIADLGTLPRLTASRKLHHTMDGSRHIDTGDRWIFREEGDLLPFADFYYIGGSSFGLPDHAGILPLIAACDLLGVDEL